MARAVAMRARRQAVAKEIFFDPPTGGINARDALTQMPRTDAVDLVNIFPEANNVVLRRGHASHATGLGAAVQTVMTWHAMNGSEKLFAVAGTTIWDVTAAGAATSAVTGLSNAKWQSLNIKTAGGLFLVCCNGADSVRHYDGTTWATPAITGVTSSTLANVFLFKSRLWFAQVNTLSLWYLGASAVAGAATEFPLGAVFRRGGSVLAMGSLTRDAGEGPEDLFAIVTTNGEVAVYQGTDPASASTWALVGLFDIGKPIGRRCVARLAGDMAIVTDEGVISMQAALQFDRSAGEKAAITSKIQTKFAEYARSYGDIPGWETYVYPKARYLIVNVPVLESTTQYQLVMNTVTGAWCEFRDMNASSWGQANDKLYFGGNDGVVYVADSGYQDAGSAIEFTLSTAWTDQHNAHNAFFTMVRPIMLTGGGLAFDVAADVDFQTSTLTIPNGGTALVGASWPITWPWTWGETQTLSTDWRTVGAIGGWVSVRMAGQSDGGSLTLNGFGVLMQPGGVL